MHRLFIGDVANAVERQTVQLNLTLHTAVLAIVLQMANMFGQRATIEFQSIMKRVTIEQLEANMRAFTKKLLID